MPQSQKFAEWNNHFCAAHKDDFTQVNKYIFQLTKYEHKDVREGIDSDDTNLLSSNAMQLKALLKWWKILFISPQKLFSFTRFQILWRHRLVNKQL